MSPHDARSSGGRRPGRRSRSVLLGAALCAALLACGSAPAPPAPVTAGAGRSGSQRTLAELVTAASTDLASLRGVVADTLVLHVTAPESGEPIGERVLRADTLDERTYAERLALLFADLRAGAPLRCDEAALVCVVSTESSAEIEYHFCAGAGGPKLCEIRAPAYE